MKKTFKELKKELTSQIFGKKKLKREGILNFTRDLRI